MAARDLPLMLLLSSSMSLCKIKDVRADRGARMGVVMMESRGEKAGVGVRCPVTESSDPKAEVSGLLTSDAQCGE